MSGVQNNISKARAWFLNLIYCASNAAFVITAHLTLTYGNPKHHHLPARAQFPPAWPQSRKVYRVTGFKGF